MSQVQYVSSDFDQLSGLGKALRWIRLTLEAILQDVGLRPKAKSNHQRLILPKQDCYVAILDLPIAPWEVHEKAIVLGLEEISPINPDEAVLAATAIDNPSAKMVRYAIAISNKAHLSDLESHAISKGAKRISFAPQGYAHLVFASSATLKKNNRKIMIHGLVSVFTLMVMVLGSWALTAQLQNAQSQLLSLSRVERLTLSQEALRHEALSALSSDVQAFIIEGQVSVFNDEMSTVLSSLPRGVFATQLRWSPGEVEMHLGGDREAALGIQWPDHWQIQPSDLADNALGPNTIIIVRADP